MDSPEKIKIIICIIFQSVNFTVKRSHIDLSPSFARSGVQLELEYA